MLRSLDDIVVLGGRAMGSGAFSHVLRCRSAKDGEVYALKVVDMDKLSALDCAHLAVEIELHATLAHPNIVRFVDGLQVDNKVYLLLEHVERGNLYQFIVPGKGLPEGLALRFTYQTMLAVRYLHENGVLHRDIKPENILLGADFAVKLCDFGWSCRLRSADERRTSVCGTFEYMSPEVAAQREYNRKTDVWAIGVLLYELLRGAPPFSGKSVDEMAALHRTRPICYSVDTSAETRALLARLLEPDAHRRIEIADALCCAPFAGRGDEFTRSLRADERETLEKAFLAVSHRLKSPAFDIGDSLPFAVIDGAAKRRASRDKAPIASKSEIGAAPNALKVRKFEVGAPNAKIGGSLNEIGAAIPKPRNRVESVAKEATKGESVRIPPRVITMMKISNILNKRNANQTQIETSKASFQPPIQRNRKIYLSEFCAENFN